MKKCFLIGCGLAIWGTIHACAAKELADCLQTGDCEEYDPPAEERLSEIEQAEIDSLSMKGDRSSEDDQY